MIGLPDNDQNDENNSITITKLINCVRLYNVPFINFTIILTLVAFLLKLTTKYKELYMKSSLITIIVTNLVLYGISESLAQTILSFKLNSPSFSIYLNGPIFMGSRTNADQEAEIGVSSRDILELPTGNDSDIGEEDLDRFLDYLGGSNGTETSFVSGAVPGIVNDPNRSAAFHTEGFEPTYFNFFRLAGFMCWGFVMAFVQCWWYKFLQIYSKHPQFVEVLRKVLSDQFCFSPVSLFCFFTYGTIVLESGTWEDAKAKLRKLYLQTLVINYSVWFPVQFINFLLIPRDFQVPFSSSVSVLWNCFLSMRNSTAK